MSQIKKFYDSTAHSYDERHDNATARYMRSVEEKIIRKYAKGRVLDVGCGTGHYLRLLENSTGIDISPAMAREARKKTKNKVMVCGAEKLPFPDNSFDSAICMFSVLNVCDHQKAVKEINRVLKPGGAAIASVTSSWDASKARIWQKSKDSEPARKSVRIEGFRINLHLFGRKEFVELFRQNGFNKIDFHSLFTIQRPYWGWYREFTLLEKIKLKADYVVPHRAGRIYIGVFQKQ